MNDEIPAARAANGELSPMTGTYADAERLRKWSFLQRTPQQRLDWQVGLEDRLPARRHSAPPANGFELRIGALIFVGTV